ncbi:MAG: hypothetical protein JWN02_2009, partial [Acidobacteria bacterium]|nr:hypothetical protein [Acidobacteriota bacterium]
MKTFITLLASLLLAAASHQALAQETAAKPAGPRDLYNTYGKSEHAAAPTPATAAGKPSTGRPGVRVRVELDRDGRARFVSPRSVFRAG